MTEELRIPVTGGELAVTDYGGPGRTVVLVHSVGYSSDVWRRFAPLLAESSRVLAVDLRGHGQSTAQLSEVLEIAADLETLVADLDLRCPVLIGHQYGGGVAAVIASLSPLLWGGLCVIDGPVTSSQAEYRGLLDIVSSEPVRDELANRFAFGASGVGEQSRERFLQEAGRRMADDWLSLPRVGSEDYQLSRSVLTNEPGDRRMGAPADPAHRRAADHGRRPLPGAGARTARARHRAGVGAAARRRRVRRRLRRGDRHGPPAGWVGPRPGSPAVRSWPTPTPRCSATPSSPCSAPCPSSRSPTVTR